MISGILPENLATKKILMMLVLAYSLLIIHIILLFWSIGGFLEMILTNVFWNRFTNPEFPAWLLLFHWSSILFAASIYIYGFLSRWKRTSQIMTFAYSMMAIVCVVETFGYMTNSTKYIAMISEFATYIIILILLYKTEYFKKRFEINQ